MSRVNWTFTSSLFTLYTGYVGCDFSILKRRDDQLISSSGKLFQGMEILMKWKLELTSSFGVSLVEASTQEFITGVKKWQDQILFFKKGERESYLWKYLQYPDIKNPLHQEKFE